MKNKLFFSYVLSCMLGGSFLYGQVNSHKAPYLQESRLKYWDVSDHIPINSKHVSDGSAKALGVELWSDDFSDPSKWAKGNGTNWQIGEWYIGTFPDADTLYIPTINAPSKDNGYAYFNGIGYNKGDTKTLKHHSWIGNAEAIDLTGHNYITLSFYSAYRPFITAKVFIDYSLDDGATWENIPFKTFVQPNASSSGMEELIIGVNGSNQFKFRFRWDDSDLSTVGGGYGWVIDDVSIISLTDVDISYVRGYYGIVSYWYSKIPSKQAQNMDDINVDAYVSNIGSDTLTNIQLNVGGDVTASSNVIDTLPTSLLGTDTLLQATFAPSSAVGIYNITRSIKMDQTDEVPENNTFADFKYEISDSIYAVDRDTFMRLTWDPYISAKAIAVGVTYDIFTDDILNAVDVKFHELSTPAGEVNVTIYKLNTATGVANKNLFGDPLGESGLFVLEDRSTDDVISIPLLQPVPLLAGGTYLALVTPTDTNNVKIEQGFSSNIMLNRQGWYYTTENADTPWGSERINPAIRLNFGKVLPICIIGGGKNSLCAGTSTTYKGLPEDGGIWNVSDTTIASITPGGVLTGIKAGAVDVIYSGSECQTKRRTVIVTACNSNGDTIVGVNDVESITDITIFPNPATDQVNIQFDLQYTSAVILEVSDLNGRVLHSLTFDKTTVGTNNVSIDLSGYDQGIYMLTLRSNNSQSVSKLIKR